MRKNTWWTFRDIFDFSLLGGGKGGIRGARKRGGAGFLIENPRRGGGSQERGGGGRGAGRISAGNLGGGG